MLSKKRITISAILNLILPGLGNLVSGFWISGIIWIFLWFAFLQVTGVILEGYRAYVVITQHLSDPRALPAILSVIRSIFGFPNLLHLIIKVLAVGHGISLALSSGFANKEIREGKVVETPVTPSPETISQTALRRPSIGKYILYALLLIFVPIILHWGIFSLSAYIQASQGFEYYSLDFMETLISGFLLLGMAIIPLFYFVYRMHLGFLKGDPGKIKRDGAFALLASIMLNAGLSIALDAFTCSRHTCYGVFSIATIPGYVILILVIYLFTVPLIFKSYSDTRVKTFLSVSLPRIAKICGIIIVLIMVGYATVGAVKIFNVATCGKSLPIDQQARCYKSRAISENNPAICELIKDERYWPQCYTGFAIDKNRPEVCDKIKTAHFKDVCYYSVVNQDAKLGY